MAKVGCLAFLMASCVWSVAAQGGFLGTLLDRLQQSPQGSAAAPTCVPYKLPAGFKTYQEWCKSLSVASDAEWDAKYASAAVPQGSQPFPLQGCVLGCLVGADSYQRGLRWGASSWSGKCVTSPSTLVNLLTPLPPGGLISTLDTFNWSTWLPVVENYEGE